MKALTLPASTACVSAAPLPSAAPVSSRILPVVVWLTNTARWPPPVSTARLTGAATPLAQVLRVPLGCALRTALLL